MTNVPVNARKAAEPARVRRTSDPPMKRCRLPPHVPADLRRLATEPGHLRGCADVGRDSNDRDRSHTVPTRFLTRPAFGTGGCGSASAYRGSPDEPPLARREPVPEHSRAAIRN